MLKPAIHDEMGLRRRAGILAAIFAACLSSSGSVSRAQEAAQCSTPGQDAGTVKGIEADFEIDLIDGRKIVLAGIEVPGPGSLVVPTAREALSGWLEGKSISLSLLRKEPDRWGRLLAHVHADAGENTAISVAYALVDAGWARVRPQNEAAACLSWLLEAERSARSRHDGLWADAAYQIVQARDLAGLASRTGQWIVVEGAVHSVNETRNRTYINFGPARNIDLAVTIPRQTMRNFTSAGVVLKQFWGKTIRVRGLLERRPGPQIEIVIPQGIEIVTDKRLDPGAISRRP